MSRRALEKSYGAGGLLPNPSGLGIGLGLLPTPLLPFNKTYSPQVSENNHNNPYSIMPNTVRENNYNRPYFSDPLTLSRVSQYLQNHKKKGKIDFDHMVDELQREFREYRRKKRWAFKSHLQKAVEVIQLESSYNQDDSDLIEDDEDMEITQSDAQGRKSPSYAFEGDGDVNSALEDSYLQQNAKRRTSWWNSELAVMKKKARALYAQAKSNGNWDAYNKQRTEYSKAVKRAKREYCSRNPYYNLESVRDTSSRKTSNSAAQELISIVTSDEDSVESSAVKDKSPNADKRPAEKTSEQIKAEATPVPKPRAPEPQTAKKRKSQGMALMDSKRFKATLEPVRPAVSFKDIGGSEKVLQEVTQMLIHMRHPEVYRVLGVSPPRGFLLHGPPGSGKTLLANAIAGELNIPLLKVAAPELVGGLSGQSEERIRELFEQAVALAPCILFIDEVDAITPNRETAHREMERRIVAQLLSSMDELAGSEQGDQVLVIGATNRPDSLDPALRRAGRFDREVCLGIPDRASRESILQTLCHSLRLAPEVTLADVAMMTPGFVGADIKSLVTEAAMAAVNRLFKSLQESETKGNKSTTPGEIDSTSDGTVPVTVMDVDVTEAKTDDGEEELVVVSQINREDKSEHSKEAKDQSEDQTEASESGNKNDDSFIEVLDNDDTNSNDIEVLKDQAEIEVVKVQPDIEVVTVQPEDGKQEGGGVQHKQTSPTSVGMGGGDQLPSPPSLLHSAPLSVEQLQGVNITMEDFREALKTVQPSAKREGFATVPDVRWEDIGSLQDIRHELEMAILAPVKYPAEFAKMGLDTPTGVLLCGPPGCGKTLLAKAVANEAGINFISVKGPELLNMYVGESERAVRQCFQRARSSQPCVIFFDEIDALAPKRMNMENGASRVVNQLLTEMDGVEARNGVFLMAATNRPDIVDPAVMRPGRLDKVLYVGLPAAEDRVDILRALTKGGKQPVLSADVSLADVARDDRCDGYTGADLAALVREASMQALKDFMGSVNRDNVDLRVCSRHFTTALSKIRPSVSERDKKRYEDLRLQYAAVPNTK